MPVRFLNPLFFIIAKSTHSEMARQVQYLKVENQILRARLPKYIQTTPAERFQLLKFGKPLGAAIKTLITIVHPRTFARWVNDETPKPLNPPKGRPRIRKDVETLVVRIARETGWGYTRIVGELRKLHIRKISRGTVKNILVANDIEPAPTRRGLAWAEFIQRHKQTLWACDFFSKSVWTPLGMRRFYVLVFIHIGSRRVHIAGITDRADRDWMAQRARELADFFRGRGRGQAELPTMVFRDQDVRFTKQFDAILKSAGVPMQKLTAYSPNLNAYIERWIQSIKHECLDHFIVFGERHLRYLVEEYVDYYHHQRPHQGLSNEPLHGLQLIEEPDQPDDASHIICNSRLGGLLKHYERRAA